MKVFITGSTGFIGQNLVQHFKEHEVFEFKRYMDIEGKLDYFQPDVIINCAAEIYNNELMWKVNVGITKACLEHCKDYPNTSMIHLGSSSEYGYSYSRATNEADALNPVDMYAGTKSIATTLCQTYGNVYKTNVVTVRPYSPYGPGEKPHRLFPKLWKTFMLDQPMNLVHGVHDFCYIDDFVNAVDILLHSDRTHPGEVVNVSSGHQTSNMEVLELFRKVTGKQGNVTVIDKFATPEVWRCDNSKMKIRLQWNPETSLEQGIKLFLEKAHYE